MNQNKTYIAFVVDRSGSMADIQPQTEEGINRFIIDQREVPGSAILNLVQFDHRYDPVFKGDIDHAPTYRLIPAGSTALLDAIGKTIDAVGEELEKMAEDERPGLVIFAIMTDGYENASINYTNAKITEMIKRQSETYNWQFVFLGANQDAIATAASMGIPGRNAVTYGGREGTQSVLTATSLNTTKTRMASAAGASTTDTIAYSDKQREEADSTTKEK